jgi:hypothetical protein
MSRKIRTRRRSAAPSCNHIEFVPSRRAAAAWLCWLSLALILVWNADLPAALRLTLCLPLVVALAALRRFVFLRGSRALRALKWSADGNYFVRLGGSRRWLAATPERCVRYGPGLWILNFVTPVGIRGLLVDSTLQEPRTLRRLSRGLDWGSRRDGAGPANRS